MRAVPLGLIYLRLLLGMVLLGMSLKPVPDFGAVAVGLMTVGLLSDILDGIVARRLGVSTTRLRRLDSAVDQLFWSLIVGACFLACPAFFFQHYVAIGLLLGLEATTYALSYFRFRREVATHSWGAKLWTLLLFGTLAQVLLSCDSQWLFFACLGVGMLSRLEILSILIVLPRWTNDVPSLYHAVRLRQGKTIRRHKLLNG
jgi:CDP-diacylglycerol--glycerol-3-phosphate 3-phosphatidyltransferase